MWRYTDVDKKKYLSGKYALLKITHSKRAYNLRLFKDLMYKEIGCYTLNNIRPEFIEKINEFDINKI